VEFQFHQKLQNRLMIFRFKIQEKVLVSCKSKGDPKKITFCF